MADFWDENLHPASFGGIRFHVRTISRSGGRETARHKYPYRDGQDLEDMGRSPYRWDIEIPLFAGMDDAEEGTPLYPDTYEALKYIFDDPVLRGEAEYVDPELGPVPAKVVSHVWNTSPGARNGGVYRVQLEENNANPFQFEILNIDDSKQDTLELAVALDLKISQFVDTGPDIFFDQSWIGLGFSKFEAMLLTVMELAGAPPDFAGIRSGAASAGSLMSNMVNSFYDDIENGATPVDVLQATVDKHLKRIDAIIGLDVMQSIDNWETVAEFQQMADSMRQAANAEARMRPTIIVIVIGADLTAEEIAVKLYDDVARADEILERNPIPNPMFYPKGSELKVQSDLIANASGGGVVRLVGNVRGGVASSRSGDC